MESFLLTSASGAGSLEFFERTPGAPRLPIERFKVRLFDDELSAVARVYTDSATTHLAALFAQMAASWKGWQGDFVWESPEGEMILRCSHDRAGHVALRVALLSGLTEGDWSIQATVMAEAGQLEDLASQAAAFFGPSS
jgi:hypothetical protein